MDLETERCLRPGYCPRGTPQMFSLVVSLCCKGTQEFVAAVFHTILRQDLKQDFNGHCTTGVEIDLLNQLPICCE